MKIKQLSLFIENKPGAMTAPCKLLADAGINIASLTLADTKFFGVLRLIIKDWEQAKEMVKEAAKLSPHVRYIGWDVGMSVNGPVLICGGDRSLPRSRQPFQHPRHAGRNGIECGIYVRFCRSQQQSDPDFPFR